MMGNSPFTKQNYSKYSEDDHWVWKTLFNKQYENLKKDNKVVHDFFEGLNKLGITHEIPKFSEINKRLKIINGWSIRPVKGLVDDDLFFTLLRDKVFPVTTWMRSKDSLDYIEEPDMFHDLFGHVPFLANQDYVDFLERIADHAEEIFESDDKDRQYQMSRLYWYTIEFGLFRVAPNKFRIYGAGIVSSYNETLKALSYESEKVQFQYEILKETFYKHDLQNFYVTAHKHIKFLKYIKIEEI